MIKKYIVVFVIMCCYSAVGLSFGNTKLPPTGQTESLLVKTDRNGNIEWQKRFNYGWRTKTEAVTLLRDGGFALLNYADSCRFVSRKSGPNLFIITNSRGEVQFEKCFPKGFIDDCREMRQLENGLLLLAGPTMRGDVWLCCMDTKGETIWQHTYHRGNCRAMIQTQDEGFVLVGSMRGLDNSYDGWIMKVGKEGGQEWFETFGGSDQDFIYDATTDLSDNIVAIGVTHPSSSGDTPHPKRKGWIIKVDSQGKMIEERTYGLRKETFFNSIIDASDHSFLIFGTISEEIDSSWDYSTFLFSVDSKGDTLWTRPISTNWEKADSIVQNSDSVTSLSEYLESIFVKGESKRLWQFTLSNKLKPMFDWFHKQDTTGRLVGPANAGLLEDGYYYSATYQHPTPPDSVWERMHPPLKPQDFERRLRND